MPTEHLTPRERWAAVLAGEKPDRTPMDYWGTDEATDLLIKHLGCSSFREMIETLHIDYAVKLVPRYCGPPLPPDKDAFGCLYRDVDYGGGVYRECVYHPLAEFQTAQEIEEHYAWPDPDWWDYSGIRELARRWADYPLIGGEYEPLLTYRYLRGEEQGYLDLLLNPEMVHHCLDRLMALSRTQILRIYEQVPDQVMFTYVAEDMGGQQDLLLSPDHIREFLLPRMRSIIDLVHGSGVLVFHHNDGSIRGIIPDLLEAGIDLLNPIQWTCAGMDRRALKRDFGHRVVFHGAMDNQQTLPFGSAEDVRREVLDNLDYLRGRDGRYILAPCHNIQANTPPENITAMYSTCRDNSWT